MEQSKETDIEKELQQAIRDKESAEELNKQLIIIMKNRANAKRGIQPKKVLSGYIVTKSEQFDYIYHSTKYKRKVICLWRTTIQTPIDIGITFIHAKEMISEFLNDNLCNQLGLNIVSKQADGISDSVRMVTKNNWNDKSYILDIKYRQNTKLRLWEMLLIHNQAITIPEEMCMSRMV